MNISMEKKEKVITSQFNYNNNKNKEEGEIDYDENNTSLGLCCCEYINKEQQPYHLVACCCNCTDFDAVFTQLVFCRKIDKNNWQNMLNTFRDRFRIPWRGGAKKVSFEAILPGLLLPILILTSALTDYAAILTTIISSMSLLYVHHWVQRNLLRTRFFYMWVIWSLIYMVVLFESTVPLLEVLPEENLLLVFLSSFALYCLYRTRKRANLNVVQQQRTVQSAANVDELTDIVEVEEADALLNNSDYTVSDDVEGQQTAQVQQKQSICSTCRKCVPPRTVHCSMCGTCILRHDHHSYWLDCCIGKSNHISYLLGMLVAVFALLLGANLTCTAVCHPLLVVRSFGLALMVPDDCSRVFDEYEFALPFMLAVYAFLMAIYIAVTLVQQIFVTSMGLTLYEHRCGRQRSGKIWKNWKNLLID